jgi:membrane-bound lytic murein transglycosylase D
VRLIIAAAPACNSVGKTCVRQFKLREWRRCPFRRGGLKEPKLGPMTHTAAVYRPTVTFFAKGQRMGRTQVLKIALIALIAGVFAAGGCATQTEYARSASGLDSDATPASTPRAEVVASTVTTGALSTKTERPAAPEPVTAAAEEAAPAGVAKDAAPDADEDNIALRFSGEPEPVDVSDAADEAVFPGATIAAEHAESDLWDRIRAGFKLNHDHKRVQGEIAWYARNQDYVDRVVDRAEPFLHLIVEEVEKRGMPMEIALLPVIESAFQPFAYSHGRASGVWQFIAGTGRLYGLKQNWWYDGRRDVVAATRAALDYLQALADSFNGDWELALASYNTGEGNVQRAVARNKRAKMRTDFWSLKLPAETRGYVPRLHAVASIVDNPAAFGMRLRSLPNKPAVAKVDIEGQIDLAFAAYLAELELADLYRLNPAFNRWATDPDGPHYLLLPVDQAEVFAQRLEQFPPHQRTRWEQRRVGTGETLASIAASYGTSADVLERVNKVKANKVRPGRDLIIPISMHTIDDVALQQVTLPEPEAAANPADVADDDAPSGEKITHVVRGGDTLYAIARKHHLAVKDIARWNNMKIHDPLRVGQELVLWSQESEKETPVAVASAVSAPLATPPQEDIMRRINYVVRRGDTLVRIADKFKVSSNQIREWNRLKKDRVRPGQRITLHIDVTRQ